MIASFSPIADTESRVLILGSMPSVQSLAMKQYYAHPRNAFWPIVFSLFGESFSTEYEVRRGLLLRKHIALWDVYAACERDASSDGSIRNGVFNDIPFFLQEHTSVHTVFVNGTAARSAYEKMNSPLPAHFLPSTSPANARMSFEEKREAWEAVKKVLDLKGENHAPFPN